MKLYCSLLQMLQGKIDDSEFVKIETSPGTSTRTTHCDIYIRIFYLQFKDLQKDFLVAVVKSGRIY